MAIFKKVADVAKSNLEALKENLGKSLDEYTDEELYAELERRKLEGAGKKSHSPSSSSSSSPKKPPLDDIGKAFASLELPRDADLEAVKAQYRKLIRRYHPDRHAGDPEKHAAAVELAQKLTKAYMKIRAELEKK